MVFPTRVWASFLVFHALNFPRPLTALECTCQSSEPSPTLVRCILLSQPQTTSNNGGIRAVSHACHNRQAPLCPFALTPHSAFDGQLKTRFKSSAYAKCHVISITQLQRQRHLHWEKYTGAVTKFQEFWN